MCLGDDVHPVSHQVDGVEADTKLTNQVDVTALLHRLKEGYMRGMQRGGGTGWRGGDMSVRVCDRAVVRRSKHTTEGSWSTSIQQLWAV